MAKFKANIKFRDLEKDVTYEAGEEFEMTLKRSDELVANIKKNHGVDIKLTRTDKDKEEEKEKIEEPKEEVKEETKEGK